MKLNAAEDRDAKVRNDREEVVAAGLWTYNDLPKGIAEAKRTGKPMLVVFRCIPCVACSGFDAQVVRQESEARDLMEKFVCVRIVQGNSMDLPLFQFDYDLSFAAFFMNADKTIYGRFGTRSEDKDAAHEISMEGFRKALTGALELHKNYPANRNLFAGKEGRPVPIKVPEDFPSLKGRYTATLDYTNQVARSCIHCHMVRDAERRMIREQEKFLSDERLFPYPMPNAVGLVLDPKEKATVAAVEKNSSAEKDGFKSGDEILLLEGQPLLSIADVQWVLHTTPEPAKLKAVVRRGQKNTNLTLTLEKGWRHHAQISWRPTSWDLRRMAFGGMKLDELSAEERKAEKIPAGRLALEAKHVGEFGEHAVAKKAGFKKGDVIIAFDGRTDAMTESDLFAYVLQTKPPGSSLPVTVQRGEEKVNLNLAIP